MSAKPFCVRCLIREMTDRDALAAAQGRFVLSRAEGVAYAAQLEEAAPEYGITENSLIEGFRLIRQDWQTDET